MVSDRATIDAATTAMGALQRFTFGGAVWVEVDLARDEYLTAIRNEFELGTIETMQDELEAVRIARVEAAAATLPGEPPPPPPVRQP